MARTATTSRRMRPRTRAALVRALAVPFAMLLGAAAAINPELALVAVVAMAAVGICLPRGELAVAAFAGSTFFDVIGSSAISPVKLLGGVVVLSGALLLLAPGRRRGTSTWQHHPVIMVFGIGLVIWAIASFAWAADAAQVRTNATRLTTDVLVLFMVPLLVRRTRDLRTIGWTIVVAALLGAVAGRLLGHEFGGRAVGMFADPNEFATATVAGAAFALALGESSARATTRWIGRFAACFALVAMVSSGSRSGIIATVVAFTILVLTARGVERIRMAGLGAVALAVATSWLMLSPAGAAIVDRIGDGNSTGRTDLWRVALYQYEDYPIHGVGLGNYPVVSKDYLRRDVANIDLFIRMPRTVHNTPLELLAELGTVGFVAFYGLVFGCLVTLRRALRLARTLRDERLVGAIRGIAASTGALLAASFTLSGLYVELMWILFGAGIASASIVRARRFEADIADLELEDVADAENPALEPAIAPLLTPVARA